MDLVTDQFPSLALALEPPTERQRTHTLTGQHLIDGALLRRVFFVLGPTISVVTLVAFSASLLSGGWQFGDPATGTTMLAASGAAWATIVLGQMANAFAVRSPTQWPGALGWTSNPYLPWAVASGLVFLVVLLYVPWLAQLLGQAPPSAIGWAVAVAVVPAVFGMDMIYKRWRAE
ncbi:cation transporting ATPase C-terminal domain-containing protein [Haloarcula pelagica]|uniref:cation transporting ATPase C-terminal domain-containing protein n=1 Tax=Haloarcula pelagica TaxID=3033389 RepID=UPI003AF32F3C